MSEDSPVKHFAGAPPPFAMTASSNFAELLYQLNCTLLVSTFQAGKLIMICATDNDNLVQLPRTFDRPMGVALKGDHMAIACRDQVIRLLNYAELTNDYPRSKGTKYDGFYTPRSTHITGPIDLHDLHYGHDQQLIGVNTTFSCLCRIDNGYSFAPIWTPPFISQLTPDDKCHLNGLAMLGTDPMYVTALGSEDGPQSWRQTLVYGGTLIHIPTGEIICRGLPMPHSPRIYDGDLYLLCSAVEKLVKVEAASGQVTDVCHIPGFVRGMAKVGDHVFVATSKLRKNASIFKDLPITKRAQQAAIYAIHLPTGAIVAQLTYHTSVDEIYDIQVIEGIRRPNILNTISAAHKNVVVTEEGHYWTFSEAQ